MKMRHAYSMHGERYVTKVVSSCSTQGSTHNFISKELASKLGIHEHDMDAKGASVGQNVPVTPLIGKLCIHVQCYVDREDLFISPLQHQDVLLGMP